MKFVLCSDCFSNSGLRLEAARVGIRTASKCNACGSKRGHKLGRKHLEKLTARFFVKGTVPHGVGGYASILQYNSDSPIDEVDLDEKTTRDWHLIKSQIGGRLFFYGPPLWRIGVTEHYEEPNIISDDTIAEIVKKLSIKTLPEGTQTFRIRKNIDPEKVLEASQYDVAPPCIEREFGRFDDAKLQILYTSPSLPVCLHECRTAITDDIFVATLEAATSLRLADLTADYDQMPESPFENLRYFFNGIFLSRDESTYNIARRIAVAIKETLSVDGFITDSFFTTVSQEPVSQNYCFFPEIMKNGKITLHSLNRLHLETVSYSYIFGPNFSTAY
jgi:hypothetical protein